MLALKRTGGYWLVDQGEAPEEAASRWREGVLEDAGASSSFAGVFNLAARSRYVSAPPVAAVRQRWSPAAAQVIHLPVGLSVCVYAYLAFSVSFSVSTVEPNPPVKFFMELDLLCPAVCPALPAMQNQVSLRHLCSHWWR